jgi:uncharacterized membrane protein/protein-disulfide isomerase
MTMSSARALVFIRVLTGVSALVSVYLLVTSLRGGHLAGCGPASGCDQILSSRWGYWMGLPVSIPALLLYGSMFAATFWARPGLSAATSLQNAWLLLNFGAWVMVAAAIWFMTLQTFVLQHLCPYCLVAHLSAVAASAVIFRAQRGALRPSDSPTETPPLKQAHAPALLAVALLIGGHWLNRPATHQVQPVSPSKVSSPSPSPSQERPSRFMEIYDGQFKINLDEVPMIGSPQAPTVILSFFDYTCPHCRKMHALLLQAEEAHRGKLAIANLPMPLDARCNPVITRTAPPHADACQLARLGLAVWRADRTKMRKFDSWIFEPELPPSLVSAVDYAENLVGGEALSRAFNEGWVEKQLAQDIAIYQATNQHFGSGAMPQLIIGTKVILGDLAGGMPDLEKLLQEVLSQ